MCTVGDLLENYNGLQRIANRVVYTCRVSGVPCMVLHQEQGPIAGRIWITNAEDVTNREMLGEVLGTVNSALGDLQEAERTIAFIRAIVDMVAD